VTETDMNLADTRNSYTGRT